MRVRAMEFPGRLKQLKELGDGGMFGLIGNNSDHFQAKRREETRLVDGPEVLMVFLLLLFLLWYSSELVCCTTSTRTSKNKRQTASTVFERRLEKLADRIQQGEPLAAPCV